MIFFKTSGPGYNVNHRGKRHFLQNSFERRYLIDSKLNKFRIKPLSHWTATVLRQLATDIASGSQSSLEIVASDS